MPPNFFFFEKKFLSLLIFTFSYSDCENLRFPKFLIFFVQVYLDIILIYFDEKHKNNLEKISFEKLFKFSILLKF